MQWFANNWFKSNWFANNWFAGQSADPIFGGARKNDDDWFKYRSLEEWRRHGRREFDVTSADFTLDVHVDPSVGQVLSKNESPVRSKNGLTGSGTFQKVNRIVSLSPLSPQDVTIGFAFPAGRKPTDAEVVTLMLLLSET